ncbi:hypothetical protein V5P93_002581 [Actinokineospora auranticolor]|uniref:Uncharacterized protein n=1 Tax=Actinokineospora auranticolor TaxID=155976 RepID=A0A2S6GMI6_9PSEU|nr:hypothetical protein [Actinokineospora auranticolor]PPK66390.1 hypothetical protein CLV40_11094 [Actinokineospora auranticolor]
MRSLTPPDPARSRAVLVGVGRYATLPPLPAATARLAALRAVVTSPDGLGVAGCEVLTDPSSAAQVVHAVDEAATAAEDLLLVHYAGRVLCADDGGEPYLATAGTDARYVSSTALPCAELRRVLRRGQAATRVLLVDGLPGHLVGAGLDVDGAFVLIAPGHTPALVAALRDGLPGRGPVLTLADLAEVVAGSAGATVRDGGIATAPLLRNQAERVLDLRSRLAKADAWLAMVAEDEATTARSVADVRIRVAGSDGLVVPGFADDLRRRLAALGERTVAGQWTAVAEELAVIDQDANAAVEALGALRAEAARLLEQRAELRGRLDAYQAMAVRLGVAEDPDAVACHRRAHGLLWTAPSDLAAAASAVEAYQDAVRRRRG